MTREPSGAAVPEVVQKRPLQAVKPVGAFYAQPSPYELEYPYVPEFMAREEPTTVPVRKKEPVTIEAAVTVVKHPTPPGYQVELPYVEDQAHGKPYIESLEREKTHPLEISIKGVPECAKTQPPRYELEYRYIPSFMIPELSGAATPQVAQEGALQAVRPAGVLYVEPPPYQLEYVYVPQFMARERPTTIRVKEKEVATEEATVLTTQHPTLPVGYQVESPDARDISRRLHVEHGVKEKAERTEVFSFEVSEHANVYTPTYQLEYMYVPEFMTREQSGEVISLIAKQEALQAVRPAGVRYVEPPPYELEYLYVPEFLAREKPTTVVRETGPVAIEDGPVAIEAAVMAIKHTIPTDYELEYPYVPGLTYRTPHAEALEEKTTKPPEVSKPEVAEYLKVRPPSYQLEYRYIPEFYDTKTVESSYTSSSTSGKLSKL
ncbi:hypothetical protein MRX96_034090 [Rhipicephalus microplus]